MSQGAVALLVILTLGALAAAALFAANPEEKQRKEAEAKARRKKLERDQRALGVEMRENGTHLLVRRGYKPAAAYLAPAKPKDANPSNVTTLRRVKP